MEEPEVTYDSINQDKIYIIISLNLILIFAT